MLEKFDKLRSEPWYAHFLQPEEYFHSLLFFWWAAGVLRAFN